MNKEKQNHILNDDLIFNETCFYRKAQNYYNYHRQLYDESMIKEFTPKEGEIYSVKFSEKSPIYYLKVINSNLKSIIGDDLIRCEVYIKQTDCRKLLEKHIIGSSQLLKATKLLVISVDVFVLILNNSIFSLWGKKIEVEFDKKNHNTKLCILQINEYNRCCSYLKCIEKSYIYKRLPNNLSKPLYKNINFITFIETMTIHDIISSSTDIVAYYSCYFNLNSSLSYVRIPTLIEGKKIALLLKPKYTIGAEKAIRMYKGKCQNNNKTNGIKCKNDTKETNHVGKDKKSLSTKSSKRLNKDKNNMNKDNNIDKNIIEKQISSSSPNDKIIRNLRKRTIHERDIADTTYKNNSNDSELLDDDDETNDEISEISQEIIPTRRSSRLEKNTKDSSKNSGKNEKDETNINKILKKERKKEYHAAFKARRSEILAIWDDKNVFFEDYKIYFSLMQKHMPRIPKMGWLEVDVHKLFKSTILKGGFRIATKKLYWKDIYKSLNSVTIVSNAATTVRTHYKRLLADFEDYVFSDKFNDFISQCAAIKERASKLQEQHNDLNHTTDNQQQHNNNTQDTNLIEDFCVDNLLRSSEMNRNTPNNISRNGHYSPRLSHTNDESRINSSCVNNNNGPPTIYQSNHISSSHDDNIQPPPFNNYHQYNDYHRGYDDYLYRNYRGLYHPYDYNYHHPYYKHHPHPEHYSPEYYLPPKYEHYNFHYPPPSYMNYPPHHHQFQPPAHHPPGIPYGQRYTSRMSYPPPPMIHHPPHQPPSRSSTRNGYYRQPSRREI